MLVFSNGMALRGGELVTRFDQSGNDALSESHKQQWEAHLKKLTGALSENDERLEETDVIQLPSNDISEIANTQFLRPTVFYDINWKKVAVEYEDEDDL